MPDDDRCRHDSDTVPAAACPATSDCESVAAALFLLCAVAVAIAPDATTSMASTLIHIDLGGMARTITWASFFTGLVCWTLGVGLVCSAVGGLYNRYAGILPLVARPDLAHRVT